MGKLRVMGIRGDRTVVWDETEAAVKEAKRIFKDHRAKGMTAFKVTPGETPVRLDQFDQTADQIVMVPRVAGG